MTGTTLQGLLIFIVAAPGVSFLVLALTWMLGIPLKERFIARFTSTVFLLVIAASFWLGGAMISTGTSSVSFNDGTWFEVGSYKFPLELFADHLSVPLITLTAVLVGIVGTFSVRYIHREVGFLRFFALLHLFAFGMLLLLSAGTFDLMIGGWELVGITSVLLIAFFHARRGPVRSAVHVFAMYKIGDLGLLLGVFVLHYATGTSDSTRLISGNWPAQSTGLTTFPATLTGLLFLFAAAAKSAQVPFSGWLPRAMEGPTPSSAIFYGALSVHAGAYLLLRIEPILRASPITVAAVVAVGALSAMLGTLAHRAAPDAKTSIAYAAMTQLGIIFMEIGLGFPRLALAHIVGHAVVRTLQFLRAPSMLHDYHRVHAAAGGHLGLTGEHYARTLPDTVRLWLYRLALHRGFYDAAADRLIVQPVMTISRWLATFEPGAGALTPALEPPRLPAAAEKWVGRQEI